MGAGRSYDNLKAMPGEERLEVLHVCTPNDLHAEQPLLAIEHGAHVVCEKPLAIDVDESARMVDRLQSRGLVGAVAYHVRGYPLVQHMRAQIAAGDIGDVRVVHGRLFCDDALADAYNWRLAPEKSGPSYVTSDLGTHWLDLAEHVTGLRITEVLGEFRTFVDGKRWQSGATSSPARASASPSSTASSKTGSCAPCSPPTSRPPHPTSAARSPRSNAPSTTTPTTHASNPPQHKTRHNPTTSRPQEGLEAWTAWVAGL
ncbi:MAG: Gfo/Idh/MocA family oxidoreductase [Thermoleophilaceae bacterium]